MFDSGKMIVGIVAFAAIGGLSIAILLRQLRWRLDNWADAMIGAFGLMRLENLAHEDRDGDVILDRESCELPRLEAQNFNVRPRPAITRLRRRSVAFGQRPNRRRRHSFARSPRIWSTAAHRVQTSILP